MSYTILPPVEVFELPPNQEIDEQTEVLKRLGAAEVAGWVKTTCPESGGILTHHEGKKFPRKGHTYPDAAIANNHIKRYLLSILLTFARPAFILPALVFFLTPRKTKAIENALTQFLRFTESVYNAANPSPLLKRQFYNDCSQQLWTIVQTALTTLGISENTADRIGKVVASIFEYDEAYRLRLEDIFSETTKEQLCQNPGREVARLIGIYQSRELTSSSDQIGGRMVILARLLKYALLIPKLKRAFIAGIQKTDFKRLQLDEIDRYWCLHRHDGYNFFGQPIEIRYLKYVEFHPELIQWTAPKGLTIINN